MKKDTVFAPTPIKWIGGLHENLFSITTDFQVPNGKGIIIISRFVMIYLVLCIYTACFYLLLIRGDLHLLNGLHRWGGVAVVWKEGRCFRIMKHNGMCEISPPRGACGRHHDLWGNRQNMEGKFSYAFLSAQE